MTAALSEVLHNQRLIWKSGTDFRSGQTRHARPEMHILEIISLESSTMAIGAPHADPLVGAISLEQATAIARGAEQGGGIQRMLAPRAGAAGDEKSGLPSAAKRGGCFTAAPAVQK